MTPRHVISVVAALLVGSLPVQADVDPRRVIGADEADRWQAVGALQSAGHTSCSAVLISATEALTAAHCVVHRATGLLVPLGGLTLVLGRGEVDVERRITQAVFSADYLAKAEGDAFQTVSTDLALLRLDPPVTAAEVTPLQIAPWPKPIGAFVDIVGYEWDGPQTATIREGCMALQSKADVTLVTCDAVRGLSGSPVFLSENPDDPPHVAAIVSSRTPGATLVVTVAPHLAELRALLRP